MYLKGHSMYLKNYRIQKRSNLSTFYVEINLNYLPEPLILTILLDCSMPDDGQKTFHLSIEKDPKLTREESELAAHLFGGNKGYQWLTSFLGLLQSIRFNYSSGKVKHNHIMIQNKLKLLTILANLLLSHLSNINKDLAFDFVQQLSQLIKESLKDSRVESDTQTEEMYHTVKQNILELQKKVVKKDRNHSVDNMVIPFGFNLLLELTFVLIVQCKSDVLPVQLRSMIIIEYDNILQSLVKADQIFTEKVSV